MKRSAISEMTPEQAADELTMMEIKKLIQKAKRAYEKAQAAEAALYKAVDDLCLDLEVPTEAENAENLDQAISCYLHYEEFSLEGLLSEIRAQYIKQGTDE